MTQLQDFPQAKIITCILPDDGQDMALLKALRREKGIISANTFQCRGFGLQLRRKYKWKRQVAGYSVRVVTVVVKEDQADDLFEYIYYQVNFDHPCPGLIYQANLMAATPYTLPAGVLEEKGE
jgi:nitrogen regulatory protein PII